MHEARKNSVQNLQTLYGVVAALALAAALDSVIRAEAPSATMVQWGELPLLAAFVVTLLPFYHGALRHLDRTYIELGGRGLRKGALLADFIILFIESCVLLGLARLLSIPVLFGWGLVVLLAVDVVWGLIAHLEFTQEAIEKAEWKWVQNNAATLIVLVPFLWLGSDRLSEPALVGGVVTLALVRTVVDYGRSWQFYYPGPSD